MMTNIYHPTVMTVRNNKWQSTGVNFNAAEQTAQAVRLGKGSSLIKHEVNAVMTA